MTAQEIMDKASVTILPPDERNCCKVRVSFTRTGQSTIVNGVPRKVQEDAIRIAKHCMLAGIFDDQRREVAEALNQMLLACGPCGARSFDDYNKARERLMAACRYVPPAKESQ